MPIISTSPQVITTSKIEKEIVVEWFKIYDGEEKYLEAFLRKYATDGSVMEQKTITIESEDFIPFYNTEYIGHDDIINKIKEIAEYKGTFKSDGLI